LTARPVFAIAIIQSIFCLAYWFIYRTWIDFWWPLGPSTALTLRIALSVLSVSFVLAMVLSFRYSNSLVRFIYRVASVWLGLSNFLFVGAFFAWLIDLILRVPLSTRERLAARPYIVGVLLVVAAGTAVYGVLNARHIRQCRVTVRLTNLPPSWRGRTALLISDMHLGHINGASFARRIASMARQLNPAIIFIAGDLYDGVKIDPVSQAAPLSELSPPFGIFFVGGNHEEFGGTADYEDALRRAGVKVLHNKRTIVDGLQIIGIPYGPSTHTIALRAFLESLHLKNASASILLNHVPGQLPVAEHAGVTLQLSGHTHGGQIFPFSWVTRRAFGKFTYGLQRFGDLQVYTSSGVGTWGPPMRVGTRPEIVLLTFE
jgi:uncharacterized protein